MSAPEFVDWRVRVGLTQAEVAKEFAVTSKYVADLEHGRRRVTRRTELAARYIELVCASRGAEQSDCQ